TEKKKVKVDEIPSSGKLSPEQKERMESKRAEAIKKLKTEILQKAPPGFGASWAKALEPEFNKEYFKKLQDFVSKERSKGTIYPPEHQVFTWTQQCDIHDVKVVILGQDPYHGPGQAHGLCFSVVKGVKPPPSLQNMFKELQQDDEIADFIHPGHGDLNGWAQQGVLLLNAVLTVRAHNANSHKDQGWEKFTDAVISWINKHLDDVVFMLWGSYAHKKGSVINSKRHHVLKAVHPSPLSAHRGFFGCGHFSKANTFLKSVGKKPIDWTKL
ncbi:LOW QUALITY PROTEIN: uracil-DNA glycosylase-like, partial [Amphiura filiformis]|uniref:LOW QUALITY PROTEIN: uracil-DNA glycosylase-like n=1 Tax=Amphiura filiformis TaxID=82378 RepID=UPI003B21CEE2